LYTTSADVAAGGGQSAVGRATQLTIGQLAEGEECVRQVPCDRPAEGVV